MSSAPASESNRAAEESPACAPTRSPACRAGHDQRGRPPRRCTDRAPRSRTPGRASHPGSSRPAVPPAATTAGATIRPSTRPAAAGYRAVQPRHRQHGGRPCEPRRAQTPPPRSPRAQSSQGRRSADMTGSSSAEDPDFGGQIPDSRFQRTEDRGQRTKDKGQRTEDRGQRAKGKGQEVKKRDFSRNSTVSTQPSRAKRVPRSHAPRGNAVRDAPRPPDERHLGLTTRSVADGIPTGDRGNEWDPWLCRGSLLLGAASE